MPYYTTITSTSSGTYASVNLDPSVSPFNATVAVALGTTGTYGMQYSLDPMTVADSAATWFDSVNMPAGTTASGVTNLAFPVARVRIVVSAIGSNVKLQVLQGY